MKTVYRLEKTTSIHDKRIRVVLVSFVILWVIIISNLFYIQIIKNDYYKQKALTQSLVVEDRKAERGIIYDRNGVPLAVNLKAYTFFAIPEKIEDTLLVAKVFSKYTNNENEEIIKSIKNSRNFVYLARKLKERESNEIIEMNLAGVYRKSENIRYYPLGGLASQVIGFTDIDNNGIEGIELQFDSLLAGKKGKAYLLRDGKQNRYEIPGYKGIEPENGSHIYSTLDVTIQQILEDELVKALEAYKAETAVGIIMDVRSNEVLAMATAPLFDPNQFPRTVIFENSRNRAITDIYEPGSTFKLIPAAAALEDHLLTKDELIYGDDGIIVINDTIIIHDTHPCKWVTLNDIIKYSSNAGIIKIAQKFSEDRFYEYLRLFGFGTVTGIELPGEVHGIVREPKEWSARSLATISFGQELAVTPLQLINAYNAIANDGALYEPKIISKISNPIHKKEIFREKIKIRDLVSKETRFELSECLIATVEDGTGNKAKMSYIPVAGKTGTAQYVDVRSGGYSNEKTIPNFIGFLPGDDPIYSCLIIIKKPLRGSNSGGLTAAPVFKNIFTRIYSLPGNELQKYVVKRKMYFPFEDDMDTVSYSFHCKDLIDEENQIVTLPDFMNMTIGEALIITKKLGLETAVFGNGIIYRQNPLPNEKMKIGKRIVFYAKNQNPFGEELYSQEKIGPGDDIW